MESQHFIEIWKGFFTVSDFAIFTSAYCNKSASERLLLKGIHIKDLASDTVFKSYRQVHYTMVSYGGCLYFADPAVAVFVLVVRIRISKTTDYRLEELTLVSHLRRKQDVRHAVGIGAPGIGVHDRIAQVLIRVRVHISESDPCRIHSAEEEPVSIIRRMLCRSE